MTRKQDLRHRRRKANSPAISDTASAAEAPPAEATVGQVLRHAREVRQESLSEIATWLRIRENYLAAIETGRYDELPGQAYAVGFVRAYAGYLDLDGEEMVRRFKQEGAVQQSPQSLHFPAPAPERNVPSSAILATVILVAAAGYAGWSYYDATRTDVDQPVPELPGRLLAMLNEGEAAADGPTDAEAATAEPAADTASADSSATETNGVAIDATSSAEAPASDGDATPDDDEAALAESGSDAGQDTVDVAVPEPESSATTVAQATPREIPDTAAAPASGDTAGSSEAAASDEPVSDTDAAGSESADGAAAATTETASLPKSVTDPDGVVLGSTGDGVRIVLQARSDTWVQVRDADGEPVFTRVLRAGDVYRVPQDNAVSLITGNAGGLAVYVDGQRAPVLGEPGEVRRDVALVPERLMGGES